MKGEGIVEPGKSKCQRHHFQERKFHSVGVNLQSDKATQIVDILRNVEWVRKMRFKTVLTAVTAAKQDQ